ncbi:hypothetical protein J1N35_040771 [Gossypium stocksii]|uniref:Uncharacterized protein n=1 Tax=Gossypium stocksii TaxID=47602 RepID=A0A9D3ZIU1_9ROSI|nr:hypothetical protein J1N35_040771 [Gossypium stocksii]
MTDCSVDAKCSNAFSRPLSNAEIYTHRLLLAMAQDDSGRILPIAFAITPGESADD